MTRWYTVAWRADNGNVIAFGDETTVHSHAEEALRVAKAEEADAGGRPDLLFLAYRDVPQWQVLPG